ncbi:HSP20-like chaperone [Fomes fomentarius]|nr:HSP20-like chaperone [Fomes fomentarius]
MPTHPEVLWAQRSSETDEKKNVLYITVNLPDIQADTLEYNLTPTKLSFKAKTGNAEKGIEEKDYEFSIDLYGEVDPEASSKSLTSRSLSLLLRKKEKQAEYWPRLTKEKVRNAFIKTDFSKWVDEDEQDGDNAVVEDDFDMGGMGGMGGMPGLGGMGGGMGDIDSMLKSMGAGAGAGGFDGAGPSGADVESDDSDDDGPPPLEEAEPKA